MKYNRILDSAAKTLQVPVDNQQTVGLSLTGDFVGTFSIVGMIGPAGREIVLTAYNEDGEVNDLTGPLPMDVFVDIVAYTLLRVKITAYTSGTLDATAVTSTAARIRDGGTGPGGGGNGGGGSGNTGATEATLAGLLQQSLGIDSEGDPLPKNFDYYQSTFAFDSRDLVQSETRIVDNVVYIKTYTYHPGTENIKDCGMWVKQP